MSTLQHRRRVVSCLAVMAAATSAAVLPVTSAVAHGGVTMQTLQALDHCEGTQATPATITLDDTINARDESFIVDCHARIDLNGHALNVETAWVNATQTLEVTDTSSTGPAGVFTATATSHSNPGIRTTDAALQVTGRAVVIASGASGAAGIGGGYGSHGGGTTIASNATVTAVPGQPVHGFSPPDAIGAGGAVTDQSSEEGHEVSIGGTLRLPSGTQTLRAHDKWTITETGELTGGSGATAAASAAASGGVVASGTGANTSATFVDAGGKVTNHGKISIPAANLVGVKIAGHHHKITFDTRGGSAAPEPLTVLASSIGKGGKSLPSAPTKTGLLFDSWNTSADGTGKAITVDSELSGISADGTPLVTTAYAQWRTPPPNYTPPPPPPTPSGTTTPTTTSGTPTSNPTAVPTTEPGKLANLRVAAPTVDLHPRYGQTVTGQQLLPAVEGAVATYQWQSRKVTVDRPTGTITSIGVWTNIPGAHHPSYRIERSVIGERLRLLTTTSAPGYSTETQNAFSGRVHPGRFAKPELALAARRGQLTIRGLQAYRDALPATAHLNVSWMRDGTITRATSSSFAIKRAARVHATITVTAAGYKGRVIRLSWTPRRSR